MTLRDRLLALIAKLKTMGPTLLLLLQFAEMLLAGLPAETLAKGAHECCNMSECCDAVTVALVEALAKNLECKKCCEDAMKA